MQARILIIEDNPANMELMTYLLGAFGHVVTTASDGAAGIGMAQNALPDLIVCDVHLPGMDGYEIVRHIKDNSVLRDIPVIAVTALAMVGDREKLLNAGFDGYIAKPIDPEAFIGQIEAFISEDLKSRDVSDISSSTAQPQMPGATGHASIPIVNDAPMPEHGRK